MCVCAIGKGTRVRGKEASGKEGRRVKIGRKSRKEEGGEGLSDGVTLLWELCN